MADVMLSETCCVCGRVACVLERSDGIDRWYCSDCWRRYGSREWRGAVRPVADSMFRVVLEDAPALPSPVAYINRRALPIEERPRPETLLDAAADLEDALAPIRDAMAAGIAWILIVLCNSFTRALHKIHKALAGRRG